MGTRYSHKVGTLQQLKFSFICLNMLCDIVGW